MDIGTTRNLPELLVTESNFEEFFQNNAVFVDKTGIISELINDPRRLFFLSRPRRFGKTLLLDTIKNIFEGKRHLFKNLDIGKGEFNHVWEPFPVIQLSFNGYGNGPAALKKSLLYELNEIAIAHKLPIEKITEISDIRIIISHLSRQHITDRSDAGFTQREGAPKNVVFLVDEYDFPLLSCIGHEKAILEIRHLLHEFYSTVKQCSSMLRFALITGITKFKQISLFSGMNNILDISMRKEYSSICGFTEDEIIRFFGVHLEATLATLQENKFLPANATVKTLVSKLMEWYDGYSWDGKHNVLNPFSIMNFFWNQYFSYYWYESGSPLFTSLLSLKNDTYFKIFSKSFNIGDTLPLSDVNNIEDEAALFQAGYLTINSIDMSGGTLRYSLKIPNKEISYAIVQEFVTKQGMLSKPSENINSKYGEFVDAFDDCNENKCSFLFSSCLAEIISYLHVHVELVPQVMMNTLLNIKGQRARMEVNLGNGRVDLLYESPKGHAIAIEIKHEKARRRITEERTLELLDKCVFRAFRQAEKKKYSLLLFGTAKKIYVAAVGVYGSSDAKISFKQKVLVNWKLRDADPAVAAGRSENTSHDRS
ncbi:MAG: AAA family ATPase [Deltaproteobacteria bacterium]|jgi:hypothetical protein|nr:AAA family ATPase [Deltaproteobacteria bacterium]